MTREEKQLVLKDLCARLPYHTKCYCEWSKEASNGTSGCVQELSTFLIDELEIMGEPECDCQISDIKPYLRPMSSMTKDEKAEYDSFNAPTANRKVWLNRIDWLLSKNFDLRGLIPLGLALEAHEGMYNN
jgi:hypothetical protein